jgi:ribosomal protein L11 methyltransferase
MPGRSPARVGQAGADRSVRVTVPLALAEEAGAILMDVLGSFEQEWTAQPGPQEERAVLVFYPPADGPSTLQELKALLPPEFSRPGVLHVETREVSRDWVDGWRRHFRPVVVGAVRIRPPWEPPLPDRAESGARAERAEAARGEALVEVVINPGLGFGTGLHPTTRGTLLLLQEGDRTGVDGRRGPLVDVGTGSGVLAIAAAKLGWSPVLALDNDPVALLSARENVAANEVAAHIEIREVDAAGIDGGWFQGATVLANMTLEPVTVLLQRLAATGAHPGRLVVSGILAGSQEEQLVVVGHGSGFEPGRRLYEEEWVSLELLPRPNR